MDEELRKTYKEMMDNIFVAKIREQLRIKGKLSTTEEKEMKALFDDFYNKFIGSVSSDVQEFIKNLDGRKSQILAENMARAMASAINHVGMSGSEKNKEALIERASYNFLRADITNTVDPLKKHAEALMQILPEKAMPSMYAERTGEWKQPMFFEPDTKFIQSAFTDVIKEKILHDKNKIIKLNKKININQNMVDVGFGFMGPVTEYFLKNNLTSAEARNYFKAYNNLVAGMLGTIANKGSPFLKTPGNVVDKVVAIAIVEKAAALAAQSGIQDLSEKDQIKFASDLATAVQNDKEFNKHKKSGFPQEQTDNRGYERTKEAIDKSMEKAMDAKLANAIQKAKNVKELVKAIESYPLDMKDKAGDPVDKKALLVAIKENVPYLVEENYGIQDKLGKLVENQKPQSTAKSKTTTQPKLSAAEEYLAEDEPAVSAQQSSRRANPLTYRAESGTNRGEVGSLRTESTRSAPASLRGDTVSQRSEPASTRSEPSTRPRVLGQGLREAVGKARAAKLAAQAAKALEGRKAQTEPKVSADKKLKPNS